MLFEGRYREASAFRYILLALGDLPKAQVGFDAGTDFNWKGAFDSRPMGRCAVG